MYHDAPVEAAVAVHRHRHRPTATASSTDPQGLSQRIVHEYQLHRVASFLLTGRDSGDGNDVGDDGAAAPPSAQPKEQVDVNATSEQSGCCRCQSSCATAAGGNVGAAAVATAGTPSAAPYVRVALQFPDELLSDSVAVVSALQHVLTNDPRYAAAMQTKFATEGDQGSGTRAAAAPAAGTAVSARPPAMDNPHRPVGEVRLFVLADNTFGSCCPDEITAQHYMTECIVHFGDACMSRSTRLPVLYIQPAFHFDAFVAEGGLRGAGERASAAQLEAQQEAETCVVVDLVGRAAATLQRRAAAWYAEDGRRVTPRLTVVGTYPTKPIMQAAERWWTASTDEEKTQRLGGAVASVDWPRFEERNGITPTPHRERNDAKEGGSDTRNHSSADASAGQAATSDGAGQSPAVADDEGWLVNGVRFARLRESAAQAEVQYLLFIGAAGSSALVHVLTAEQYNEFHYSEACREFLEWDSGEESTTLPVVTVVNNAFGVDVDDAATEEAALQTMIASPATDANQHSNIQSHVSRWVSAALPDGVSALVTGDYVVAQQALQRRVRQRAFNIESVRASTAIGVLVASLAIEGYYELTQQLHQLIRAYGKRSYVIYVGHLNEFKLANFVDTVDCFVAVACPYSRQSHFPEKRDNFMKPIVSPAELLVALTTTDDTTADAQYGMAAVYTTSFETSLRVLRTAVASRKAELAANAAADAAGDDAARQKRQDEEAERFASSGALVRAGGAGGGALTVQDSSQGALARLYEREYVGLDPRIGQTPVQTEVMEGKHGIARGYAKEREEQHAEPPVSQYK